jgi:hypothetical protein
MYITQKTLDFGARAAVTKMILENHGRRRLGEHAIRINDDGSTRSPATISWRISHQHLRHLP